VSGVRGQGLREDDRKQEIEPQLNPLRSSSLKNLRGRKKKREGVRWPDLWSTWLNRETGQYIN